LGISNRHSGARAKPANPESRGKLGVRFWIPGSRFQRAPEWLQDVDARDKRGHDE
jgi:hypothetical protein